MKNIGLYEDEYRGTVEFPVAFHYINSNHPKYNMNLHWHVDAEIILIERGKLNMQLNYTELRCNAGDVVYIPGGVLHGGVPSDCEYDCIVFNEKLLFRNAPILLTESERFACSVFRKNNRISRFVSAAILESKLMGKGDAFRIYGNLYNFYADFPCVNKAEVAVNTSNMKKIETLKNALKLIETGYQNPITLDMLASSCNVSSKYFCRFFREMTGKTPFEYLNSYRTEAACEMFSRGMENITEVAFSCGFNDLSYFIKTFKKYKGLPPRKYIAKISLAEHDAADLQ